jgi:class 3 adenylate cyclase
MTMTTITKMRAHTSHPELAKPEFARVSRMESGGLPGMIQVPRSVYDKLKERFAFAPRGQIEIKGRSGVEAWLLKI